MSPPSTTPAPLPTLNCPACGVPMPESGPHKKTASFEDCRRTCQRCGVGYSNGQTSPTLVYRDPLHNIPPQVRLGARAALASALNVRNRPVKTAKFGFASSEDALTWIVFSHLHSHHRPALPELYRRAFGVDATQPPTLLLWGAPVPAGHAEVALAGELLAVVEGLEGNTTSHSEPDVVLDFGDAGVVLIEVKLNSENSRSSTLPKFDRYTLGSPAFRDGAGVAASGLYELARNWRIAHKLADGRPYAVVNLARSSTLASTAGLADFAAALATSPRRRFLPVSWGDLLAIAERATGGLPAWLRDALRTRHLP